MTPKQKDAAAALEIALKIDAKIQAALRPLEREMQLMGWAPEYRRIVWEAVSVSALKRAKGGW